MTYSNENPEHPARVTLATAAPQIVFVQINDDQYAAEVDGQRCPIRLLQQESRISESGYRDPYKPTQAAGATANIDNILRCLALDAAPKPLPGGVELRTCDNWGHFRQNTFFRIKITIAADGAVEIDEDIQVQDESYY